jgi:hypothetical protein
MEKSEHAPRVHKSFMASMFGREQERSDRGPHIPIGCSGADKASADVASSQQLCLPIQAMAARIWLRSGKEEDGETKMK